jgi:hypothetical protein
MFGTRRPPVQNLEATIIANARFGCLVAVVLGILIEVDLRWTPFVRQPEPLLKV